MRKLPHSVELAGLAAWLGLIPTPIARINSTTTGIRYEMAHPQRIITKGRHGRYLAN
jgi:hypothetical protein